MKEPRIAGIILAAGSSSRMGRVKQLLEFEGRPILEIVVHKALAAGLEPLIIVLGHQADAIRRAVNFKQARIIYNPRYQQGQSTSLQAGLDAVPGDCPAVMFLLGDQPLLEGSVMARLTAAYRRHRPPLVIPEFNGQRGNPVIVDRELFPRLHALTGDSGARKLFAEYRSRTVKVAVDSDSIHFDLDVPEDYSKLKGLEKKS